MEDIKELVEDVLKRLVEDEKKVDFGVFKFEIRTDGDSIWATGSKSQLYKDIEEDLSNFEKKKMEEQIEKLQKELIKLQDLFVELVEDIE